MRYPTPSCYVPSVVQRQADDASCWLCGRKLTEQTATTATTSSDLVCPAPLGSAWQFSLGSLFLLTTLVAVVLGVFLIAPGLGIVMAIALAPALVREWGIASMWRRSGRPRTWAEQGLSLLGSLLVVVVIAASAFTAFFTVCLSLAGLSGFSLFQSNADPILGAGAWVFGVAAGLGVGGTLLYQLWLKWHFRFRREGKPPTLNERVVAVLQTIVLHLSPLVIAYFAALMFIIALNKLGYVASLSGPQTAAYLVSLVAFFMTWPLAAWLSRKHFRAFTYLTAFFVAGLVCWLAAAWLQGFVLHIYGHPRAIYYWTSFTVGGIVGIVLARRWPLPHP